MKLMRKFIIIFLLYTFLIQNTFSSSSIDLVYIPINISKKYDDFIKKVDLKTDINYKISILEKLSLGFEKMMKEKKFSTKDTIILKYLIRKNSEKITFLKSKKADSAQLDIEAKEKQKFIETKTPILPDYVVGLLGYSISYKNVNDSYEFLDKDKKIKKILFAYSYYVNTQNFDLLKNKTGIIIPYQDTYVFIENYKIETKIPYSEASKYFKYFINDELYSFSENENEYNGVYYEGYNYFQDKYGFYESDMKSLNYKLSDLALIKSNNVYGFTNKFKIKKLISKSIISGIENKNLFLSQIYDDKKSILYETDNYFLEIKKLTENLTKGLSKDEKIKNIYDWILSNISYTNPIDLSNKEIFSGIDTYKNKDGVCEGYVKLMAYMLMFAGIEDFDVKRGFVINAQDFPKIGHAWIKIGSYYYDPTFDDPIGLGKTRQFNEYEYFKLPADLIYSNRYDLLDLPEDLKLKSRKELQKIVDKNLLSLANLYKDSNYNVLKYANLLNKYGFSYNDDLTISKLKTKLPYFEVSSDFSYFKNGEKKYIQSIKFYKITDENIRNVFYTVGYDLSNKSLLKWDLGAGSFEYRLAEIK